MRPDSSYTYHSISRSPDLPGVHGCFPRRRCHGFSGAGTWVLERDFSKSDSGYPRPRSVNVTLIEVDSADPAADLSYATGQLIVSNSVERQFQGIAGKLLYELSERSDQLKQRPFESGGIVSMLTNYSYVLL